MTGRTFVNLRQLLEERPALGGERYLRRLVSECRIPFYKPAGKLIFDLSEVDDWIQASRVEAAS